MKEFNKYVGLDIHAASIEVGIADTGRAKARHYVPGRLVLLNTSSRSQQSSCYNRWMRKLIHPTLATCMLFTSSRD